MGLIRSRVIGKFPSGRNQSQFKDHLVQENILKIEKVFQVRENTAKIRDGFLGCDMKPRSLPTGTPKMHLEGLSFILYLRRLLKVSVRSAIKESAF